MAMVRMPLQVIMSEPDGGGRCVVRLHCAEDGDEKGFRSQADAITYVNEAMERWMRGQYAITSDVAATEGMLIRRFEGDEEFFHAIRDLPDAYKAKNRQRPPWERGDDRG